VEYLGRFAALTPAGGDAATAVPAPALPTAPAASSAAPAASQTTPAQK
jgi:hypothetical protein